jgi:hypothetical protein
MIIINQSSNVHQLMVMIFVHLFVVFVYDEPKSCDWVLIEKLFLELVVKVLNISSAMTENVQL